MFTISTTSMRNYRIEIKLTNDMIQSFNDFDNNHSILSCYLFVHDEISCSVDQT